MLPRTVASFYGSTVPRPYVVCDALGEVKQDRVAKPRVNAALVEWARSQSWSRGGLLADAVLRSAGRTTDASGCRKLRAEGEEEEEEVSAPILCSRGARTRSFPLHRDAEARPNVRATPLHQALHAAPSPTLVRARAAAKRCSRLFR